MDIKKLFPGGEPKISNPDLMRMQFSNYYGIQNISKVLGDSIVSGCELTLVSVTYNEPRIAVVQISDGWCIVGGELVMVDAQEITFELTNNIPAPGSSFYINMGVETFFDPLGDKTFNDSVPRQTWEKRRGIISVRTSYQLPTPPPGTFDVGNILVRWDTLTADIYTHDDNFATRNFNSNWNDKYSNITTGNRLVGLSSNKNLIDGPRMVDLVTRVDSDYVYTKTIPLGTWNMTTGYTTSGSGVDRLITRDYTGIPNEAKITEMHVTINSDGGGIIHTDYSSSEKEDSPVVYIDFGVPQFKVANCDRFAGSVSYSDTTTNRGYLTIKYIIEE